VPDSPADVDLYLDREAEDGSWEDTGYAGESFSTESETLSAARLEPGHYRVLVHNWAGGPIEVELTGTFFNGNDEPGEPGGGASLTEGSVPARATAGLMQP
jgi:hypothetical protein